MVLRAKRDMDQGDEVTLSYIDIALPEAQRNHKLVRAHSQKPGWGTWALSIRSQGAQSIGVLRRLKLCHGVFLWICLNAVWVADFICAGGCLRLRVPMRPLHA